MTIERGLGENIVLRSISLYKRVNVNGSYNVQCWHSFKDASWNISVYHVKDGQRNSLAGFGTGWDFVQACENYRVKVLEFFSEMYQYEFTNFAEVESKIDEVENIIRNDVGAVVDFDSLAEEVESQDLVGRIDKLEEMLAGMMDVLKTIKTQS